MTLRNKHSADRPYFEAQAHNVDNTGSPGSSTAADLQAKKDLRTGKVQQLIGRFENLLGE